MLLRVAVCCSLLRYLCPTLHEGSMSRIYGCGIALHTRMSNICDVAHHRRYRTSCATSHMEVDEVSHLNTEEVDEVSPKYALYR